MTPQRDWFTIREVAPQLGIPIVTFGRWVRSGLVDAEIAGKGTYLIHRSEIDALRQNGNRPAGLSPNAAHRTGAHDDNTPCSARNGGTSIRPSVRRSIVASKRYRLKSTGEVVTGAELLRRREDEANPE